MRALSDNDNVCDMPNRHVQWHSIEMIVDLKFGDDEDITLNITQFSRNCFHLKLNSN